MLNREQQQRLRDNRRDRRALNEKLALHMSLLRSAREQIGVVNAQLRSSASKYRGWHRNAEGEAPMPWRNPVRYPFDKTSIILNAPNGSGVYALRNEHTWIYVGESKD